ncbi:MAG: hypothetical protein Q8K99_04820 [Actinomycetota bacterium]|nr:hypothetical protein [Actinomycetota bacterium]
MVQASEVLVLLGAVLLMPLIWRSLSALRLEGRGYLRAGLLALLVAYVTTIAEGFVAFDFFNAVEHGGYAVAGILFVLFGAGWLRRVDSGRVVGS